MNYSDVIFHTVGYFKGLMKESEKENDTKKGENPKSVKKMT